MYLATGFMHEFGLDWSVHVKEDASPTKVAKVLSDALIGSSCCGSTDDGVWPSQILMIKNGLEGPVVFDRYWAGLHYPRTRHDDFESWEERHVTAKRMGQHQSST